MFKRKNLLKLERNESFQTTAGCSKICRTFYVQRLIGWILQLLLVVVVVQVLKCFQTSGTWLSLGEKASHLKFPCFRRFVFSRTLMIFPVQITIARNQGIGSSRQGEKLLHPLTLMQGVSPSVWAASTSPFPCTRLAAEGSPAHRQKIR